MPVKIFVFLTFLSFFVVSLSAQSLLPSTSTPKEDSLIDVGIKHYDQGEYDRAIAVYESILQENKSNASALGELALSRLAKQEYDQAIEIALEGLKYDSRVRSALYLYLANAYDLKGFSEKAIQAYLAGLSVNPNSHMLHYNLGLAYQRIGLIDSAQIQYQAALLVKPTHPSSNLALAQLYTSANKRVPAIFAYLRFLILEPASNRSQAAATKLKSLLGDSFSVTKTGEGKFNVRVQPDSDGVNGDLTSLELSLAMEQTASITGDSVYPSNLSRIASELGTLFQIASELSEKEPQGGFCWHYYIPYFAECNHRGFTPSAIRYIFQSTDKEEAKDYLRAHLNVIKDFVSWNSKYVWK